MTNYLEVFAKYDSKMAQALPKPEPKEPLFTNETPLEELLNLLDEDYNNEDLAHTIFAHKDTPLDFWFKAVWTPMYSHELICDCLSKQPKEKVIEIVKHLISKIEYAHTESTICDFIGDFLMDNTVDNDFLASVLDYDRSWLPKSMERMFEYMKNENHGYLNDCITGKVDGVNRYSFVDKNVKIIIFLKSDVIADYVKDQDDRLLIAWQIIQPSGYKVRTLSSELNERQIRYLLDNFDLDGFNILCLVPRLLNIVFDLDENDETIQLTYDQIVNFVKTDKHGKYILSLPQIYSKVMAEESIKVVTDFPPDVYENLYDSFDGVNKLADTFDQINYDGKFLFSAFTEVFKQNHVMLKQFLKNDSNMPAIEKILNVGPLLMKPAMMDIILKLRPDLYSKVNTGLYVKETV